MPAFTFENLSTPVKSEPAQEPAKTQRTPLGHLFNRLAEARTKRAMRREQRIAGEPPSAQNSAARRPKP